MKIVLYDSKAQAIFSTDTKYLKEKYIGIPKNSYQLFLHYHVNRVSISAVRQLIWKPQTMLGIKKYSPHYLFTYLFVKRLKRKHIRKFSKYGERWS